MDQKQLQELVDQFGTLTAVANHLEIQQQTLSYWVKKNDWHIQYDIQRRKKKANKFDVYEPILLHLAALEWSCKRILDALGLKPDEESLRTWLIRHNAKRNRKNGTSGKWNPAFVTGLYNEYRDDAYIFVPAPKNYQGRKKANGWVAEHRLVMEEKLGRLLLPDEVCHHIDWNGKNNHPDNLMVFPNNEEHLRFHQEQLKAMRKERLANLLLLDQEYVKSLGWGSGNDDLQKQ